jgi:hypothetical protein
MTQLDDWKGLRGNCLILMIPIKLAFDLLTTPPPMSQCRQYNFTAGTAHSDNNMLALIVPRFEEVPPSLSVFVHGPHQVWEL